MKVDLAILNSDAINKYGYCFAVSALESAMNQRAITGVPMHLGHDMHRPVGWMIPFGLYFQPGLVRSIGRQLIIETEQDQKEILSAKKGYMSEILYEEIQEHEKPFLPHISELISDNHKYLNAGAFSVIDDKIVEKAFPHLVNSKDKDGLIPLSDLLKEFIYKSHGVFFHNKLPLCIYVHQYFRRSLSRHNNFHFIFLNELMSHIKNPEITVKISIDWDMLGYSPSYHDAHELEYWFGPKYKDDISSISPGLTKHSSNTEERLYHGISSTEFFWKENGEMHEFELEELKEDQSPTLIDSYGCRYIHSIYEKSKGKFIHFDGAIRSYNSELYFERINKKMTEFGRRSQYTKLFRVDGKLELKDWKSLTTNYLQGNPLIYEYFGLEKPAMTFLSNNQKSIKEKLVPYSMNKGDGIRMLVSYHKKNTQFSDSHIVTTHDLIEMGDGKKPVIEYDIIEVKKSLDRLGKTLILPENTLLISTKDFYWNIPCIFHGGDEPQQDVNITTEAIKAIISGLIKKKRNRIISFTLSWNHEDKEIRISILGHVVDLENWFSQSIPIPTNRQNLVDWLEKQKNYINSFKATNAFLPLVEDIVYFDGMLYIKREVVPPGLYEFEKGSEGINYKLTIPEDQMELVNAVRNSEITPAMAYLVKEKICSVTNKDYWVSPHSKILDEGVHTIVSEIQQMHLFWTDKPFL